MNHRDDPVGTLPKKPNQTADFHFDHHAEAFVHGHKDINDEIRQQCPVGKTDAHGGFWVLSGHAEVTEAARDDVRFSSEISLLIPPSKIGRLLPLQADPPRLQIYRLALMPFFKPKAVATMTPAIEADTKTAIDAMLHRGRGEIVNDLGLPVPGRTTMRVLGLAPDRWEEFGRPINQVTFAHPGSTTYANAEQQIRAFDQKITEEIDQRLATPREDGISRLIAFRHNDVRFTRDELIALVRMIIFGGLDTVTGAIGNIVAILATRQDLQDRLRQTPDLLPSAIEEFLRFEAPIQGFARKATCSFSMGGRTISKGDRVWLNWGAANHDPSEFDEPALISLNRRPNRHLTFGIGGHVCSGARLARAEIRIMLETLLSATSRFDLTGEGIVYPRTIGQLLGKKAVHIRMTPTKDSADG